MDLWLLLVSSSPYIFEVSLVKPSFPYITQYMVKAVAIAQAMHLISIGNAYETPNAKRPITPQTNTKHLVVVAAPKLLTIAPTSPSTSMTTTSRYVLVLILSSC